MIGIVTFFDEPNYGAALQAYALQTVLTNDGYESEFVNLSLKSIIKDRLSLSLLDKIKILLLNKSIEKKLARFRNFQITELKISNKRCDNYSDFINNEVDKYETLIYGSDQIWNPKLTGGELSPFYFGADINSSMKIAYAASCGNNKVIIDYREKYIEYLSGFKGVSVREKSTARAINEELGIKCMHVLDPTLLLQRQDWNQLIKKSSISKEYLDSKYIFVYSIQENELLNSAVETLSKKLDFKVITLRNAKHYNNEIARFPHADPYDFLALINSAQIVVTNSYHAMLFSYMFEKQIALIPHSLYNERIEDFVNLFSINPQDMYYQKDSIDIKKFTDNECCDKTKYETKKKKSFDYLIQNLGGKNEKRI